MKSPSLRYATLAAVTLLMWSAALQAAEQQAAEQQFAHTVFFQLKEDSADARAKVVAGCKKYLSKHEGTVHFAVGVRAKEMERDVNVRDFDVSLHLVFRDKKAHDVYQEHPRHTAFIKECSDLWAGVRVFDSLLANP